MKISIEKLRWLLAGGSVALLLLLIGVVGYGRYRAARLWKSRLNALGVHIEQTTDNITYSQTIGGRTVFLLKAGKAIQRKDGKVTLRNVMMTLYGKTDGSEDHIYGDEFEYDQRAGVARALGDVQMDLRVPGALPSGRGKASSTGQNQSDRDIHVKTRGLTYVKSLGVAATQEQVTFQYAGLECTATGAEFSSADNVIHLLANVALQGTLKGKPISLHAAKADLDHESETVLLTTPTAESGLQKGSASSALLQLQHDGTLRTAHAEGSVILQSRSQRVEGAHLEASFHGENIPDHATLSGGVVLTNTDPARRMQGSAQRLDGVFDNTGAPVRWNASGGASLRSELKAGATQQQSRILSSDRMEATMQRGKAGGRTTLSDLHLSGHASVTGDSAAQTTGTKHMALFADDLHASFANASGTQQSSIQQVVGTGHARIEQSTSEGDVQTSKSDNLLIHFVPDPAHAGAMQVADADQNGNVNVFSRSGQRSTGKSADPITAQADHSHYENVSNLLTLSGHAKFVQGETTLVANTIQANQLSGDANASGGVLTTLLRPGASSGDATHISADRVIIGHATQAARFLGTDAQPSRLWQGASQLQAATIVLDQSKHTLSARPQSPQGVIRTVFASESGTRKSTSGPSPNGAERVTANAMDYDDASHTATFDGSVRALIGTEQVQSTHAQLVFAPNPQKGNATNATGSPFEGSLQKAVVWGGVLLSEPGRTGRGDRLVYTAADGSFLLTGSANRLPQIVDVEKGSISGASLLFRSGDNEVIVSGAPSNGEGGKRVRVQTETGAKQ